MRHLVRASVFITVIAIAWAASPVKAGEERTVRSFTPVTDQVLLSPGGNDWPMFRRTYDSWGYSPLNQINTWNVHRLQLAWAWTQEPGNQEAAPLVHNGIMYLAQSNNVVHALDARTGDLIWEYRHKVPELKGSYVKRQLLRARNSITLYDDKVFLATGDARMVALNARTGQVVWNVAVADYNPGFNYTAGPLAVKGMVIAGISGCTTPDTGGGCFITAHDAKTGKEVWRTHTIARPGDPADATWAGLPLKERKGGSAWGTGSYDPRLDLIFWGTGAPIPHSEMARGTGDGALLYTNSTLALNPDTGKIVWYFQHLPRDNWNLDHSFERVLVDTQVNGKPRRLLLTLGKAGIVTALDRETGEWVWSTETVYQNVISRIDPRTGAVTLNEEVIPRKLNVEYLICPSFYGGKIWQTTAYHPAMNALYVPLANMCMDFKVVEQEPTPGEDFGRGRLAARHAPNGNGLVGRIDAIDVATGRRLWKHERRPIVSSSLLTTAGGLVIGGDASRRLVILDARSGSILVEKPLNAAVAGFPMTYMVNGKQYLAVPTGTNMMAQFSSPLTPENRVPSDRKPGNGSMLLVFTLPDAQ